MPSHQPVRTAAGHAEPGRAHRHPRSAGPAGPGAPPARDSVRLLVVEDDPDLRDLVVAVLADEGYDVLAASDGAQALERVGTYRPAVILLDMQMPRVDGPTFARRYRALPGPHAPIIVLTANEPIDVWVARVGAAAGIGKPFNLEALTETVLTCADAHDH